jgi:hypothetical protein
MRGTGAVEIGSGNAVECSRRILLAYSARSLKTLENELTRASSVCRRTAAPRSWDSSLAAEQADLLDAIVGGLRASISGHIPRASAEISLLGHLARA